MNPFHVEQFLQYPSGGLPTSFSPRRLLCEYFVILASLVHDRPEMREMYAGEGKRPQEAANEAVFLAI